MKTKLLFLLISLLGIKTYSQNYILDNSFGGSGLVTTTFGSNYNYITSIELQADGKILACGNYENGNFSNLVISRYNEDGTLDNSFGILGKVTTSISNNNITSLFKIKLQSDGKILIGGTTGTSMSTADFILLRLNTDGSFDNSFGTNGTTITDINNKSNIAYSIEVQSDNKILLAGRTDTDSEFDNFAVIRYNSNGVLDDSFGNLGIVNLNIGNSNSQASNDGVSSIKLQSNGKILLGGSSDATSAVEQYNFTVIRLNTDGTLDNSFGNAGKMITDMGGKEEIISLDVTTDDKIIAGGHQWDDSTTKICLAKYNINGALDTTFGVNGIVLTQINNIIMNDTNYQTSLLSDGKILCIGSSNDNFLMVRYNTNGTLDNSFNTIGYLTTDFFGGNDAAFSSINQSNGNIILGGGATNLIPNVTFALAKYKVENLSNISFLNYKGFKLYPNPTTTKIYIDNLKNDLITEINIFDMQGKTVLKEKDNFNQINIENLNSGIYNLKINTENKSYNYKIIKD